MKTIYRNIYSVLKINRFVVISVTLMAFFSTSLSGWIVFKMHQEALNKAFIISEEGAVIPLKWLAQKENLQIEALAHLDLFHNYFYDIDASNYERNLEKALWLGDSSVDNLYRQKKADGVYNRLLQYSLVQNVLSTISEIDIDSHPIKFRTTTVFEINRGSMVDTYELISTGNLTKVDRNFPKNTHGLLITNYFENTLKKMPHEN